MPPGEANRAAAARTFTALDAENPEELAALLEDEGLPAPTPWPAPRSSISPRAVGAMLTAAVL